MRLTDRVISLKPSSTLEISAKAAALKAQGKDVISLAAGEPDFNTPQVIRDAAYQAMNDGLTRYTPAKGFLALREVMAEKLGKEKGFSIDPDELIITCGAKHALYLALQCLAQPGDTVLLPTPAWVSYGPMIELAGAKVMPLPLLEEDGYQVNVDRWKGLAIPDGARGIILNSPNNPTGMAYSRDELIKVVSWALQRNLWIIADEVYERLLYDGFEHTSVASLGPEVREHCVTVSSFSKTYAMTGWRVGWAISSKTLIGKMASLQSQSTSNVTSFAQWAAITAANMPDADVNKMLSVFEGRRNYVAGRLEKMSQHLSFVMPRGAFYFFVNITPWLSRNPMTDVQFCTKVLEEQFVGLVPGSAFGKEKCFRLSYATSEENLQKALDRLESFLNTPN